jgi:shikimate dehydrogenase
VRGSRPDTVILDSVHTAGERLVSRDIPAHTPSPSFDKLRTGRARPRRGEEEQRSRYAVFGQPIEHSLSPRIHTAFGAQCGLAVDYRAIETGRETFANALDAFACDRGRGANVTLPLKQDALALCASVSERAQRCGSVNTLIRANDGWHGDSTDGVGLLRDLSERHGFDPRDRRILLLGAGGAARAAAFALAEAGAAELVIANRTAARADALARAIGGTARARGMNPTSHAFDLVINATSAGHAEGTLELPRGALAASTFCYDLSYGKPAQRFLAQMRAAGAVRISDGLGMLVEQAAESFALWHAVRPPTAAVYALLRAEGIAASSASAMHGGNIVGDRDAV